MKKKIYAEIGFGNDSILSTEIEKGSKEYRVKKFIFPRKIESFYIRFWIFRKVLVLSSNQGLLVGSKNKNKLKILFGISGYLI